MIYLKNNEEIEKIKRASVAVANGLLKIKAAIRPGVSLKELDKIAEEHALSQKGIPAFKGYRSYPASLCVSVNHVVVHGIPNDYLLKDGDIVGIDYGIVLDGYYGDSAMTIPVGVVSDRANKLMSVTQESLMKGIAQARPGNRIGDISYAVQSYAESHGFSVVRNFVGHGIGKRLHEEPQIPNFGPKGKGLKLEVGMVLAIEPMINEGTYETEILSDGWTAVTKDRKLSAHFEHTVAILKDGPIILSTPDMAA
ncbi:MAG: type I methionyl aminopeptidase [Nitrospirae bacterium]|jgi:methionyl aminopeptidase|nr:type I methionyl aminopeptidase [Nitrospirota bacterium]MCL5259915.1 type I methionyl aminopeptidase [Nitrospirota bacterium]